jgi:hypothetical protein
MSTPAIPSPELLEVQLPRLAARWSAGQLADAEYAAAYFLVWRIAVHGRRFASRRSKSDPRPDPAAWLAELESTDGAALRASLIRWFGNYHFLEIIPNVPAAFFGWLRDGWPLKLLTGIPAPLEVLALQAAGNRPVTVIGSWPRASRPVLAKADGCHFLVHDLEHAWKFFHDPALHAAQRRLFGLLLQAVDAGLFAPYRGDPAFAAQFDYVASDMNTHPVHSLRYLAAVLIECLLRREGKSVKEPLSPGGEQEMAEFLAELGRLWEFPEPARSALQCLLKGGFGEGEARLVERGVMGAAGSHQSPAAL